MDASIHGQKSTVGTEVFFRRSISSTKKQRRDSFDRRLKSPAVQFLHETTSRYGGLPGNVPVVDKAGVLSRLAPGEPPIVLVLRRWHTGPNEVNKDVGISEQAVGQTP